MSMIRSNADVEAARNAAKEISLGLEIVLESHKAPADVKLVAVMRLLACTIAAHYQPRAHVDVLAKVIRGLPPALQEEAALVEKILAEAEADRTLATMPPRGSA